MLVAGMTVAILTAGVPTVRYRLEGKPGEVKIHEKCYSEKEIRFLMETTNSSRARATEVLKLACDFAVTPK